MKWPQTRRGADNLSVALICLIFVVSASFFGRGEATAIAVALLALYANIAVKWDHRMEAWFRVVVAIFVVAHAIALALLRIGVPKGPAVAYILPAALVDGFLMFGIMNVVEAHKTKSR